MSTNLEFYRKQAKALLKSAQAGNAESLERIARQTGRTTPLQLHHAQLTIAREQGFASWPRFRSSNVDHITEFIDAAVSSRKRAEELLTAHPELATNTGFYAALVLGNAKQIARELKTAPELATAKSGPQNCEPILYVCFSRLANKPGLAQTAQILLSHGADPNTVYKEDGHTLPCLYAATGLNNNPALGDVLLNAGANPNDGESLYHSTEHADLTCLKLLLRHGAKPAGSNALKHMLDREDMEGLDLLLNAGADPNEVNGRNETALHWAAWRERTPAIIGKLLDHGANPQTRRDDGRTAYAIAVQTGQADVVQFMETRGAATEVSALDRALGEPIPQSVPLDPANHRLLPDLTASHRTAAVRALLEAGAPLDARGELGATALHWACWKGYADLVELLLQRGAPLDIEDEQFHADPAGWLDHGRENCGEPGGDYAAVESLLNQARKTIY
ncbi:MAG: ankyrin repeat domain-containing protein [Acidobacteria bacterium]|nr:ankyrin repeat domain-containing protein [Acidobacteriota bacterium]